MIRVERFLKEWNAVVEALGQGKQTILIRKYDTKIKEFLLYPTSYYAKTDYYLDSFQKRYHSFVEENSLPYKNKEGKIQIKYFAKFEQFYEYKNTKFNVLEKNSIWTNEHIQSYLKGKSAIIWLMRIYKLDQPFMTNLAFGIRYSKTNHSLKPTQLKPVINDKEFSKIRTKLKKLIN